MTFHGYEDVQIKARNKGVKRVDKIRSMIHRQTYLCTDLTMGTIIMINNMAIPTPMMMRICKRDLPLERQNNKGM